MNNKEILSAWLKYIEVEDLEAVSIDQKKVEQKHHVKLKVKTYDGNFYPECSLNETLLNEIVASIKKDENEYYWFFPLTKKFIKGKNVFFPLFAIPINQSIDVESKSISEAKTFEASNNVIPIFPVLQKLGVEAEELPANLSFIDLIAHIVDEKRFDSLEKALLRLNDFVNKNDSKNGKVEFADGVVMQLQANNFSKELRKDHEYLIDKGVPKGSLLDQYLQNKSNYALKPLRELKNNTFWYGAFDKHPLGKGQAVVMQHFVEDDRIIAVQGGPGTGKTTLILSIIANTIVKRAYSIAKDNQDFNNLMQIVSTSNKAVENVAERFMTDPLFSKRDDFYFIAGNKKNKESSSQRIENYLNELKSQEYNEDLAESCKKKFLDLYSDLENQSQEYIIEETESKKLQEALIKIKQDIDILNDERTRVKEKINKGYETYNIYPQKSGFTDWDEVSSRSLQIEKEQNISINTNYIEQTENYLRKTETEAKTYNSLIESVKIEHNLTSLTNTQIIDLLKHTIFEGTEDLLKKLENLSWFDKIFDFIVKKRQNIYTLFNSEYESELNQFNIQKMTAKNLYENIGLLNAIKRKVKNIQKNRPSVEEYAQENWIETHNIAVDNLNAIKNIYVHSCEQKTLQKNIETLENDLLTIDKNDKKLQIESQKILTKLKGMVTNAADAYRLKEQKENDRLFKLSMEVMAHEVKKNKENIISSLEDFKKQLSGYDKDVFGRWQNKLNEFARYISMVYPVITSTMASSASLFFSYPNNVRDKKPIYLVLSDESGMAKPNELLPALFRAERAIVVGDPKQLPPIVPLSESTMQSYDKEVFGSDMESSKRYSPTSTSAYHRSAACDSGHFDDIGDGILLDEHRRCQNDIAKLFIKVANYVGLQIKTEAISEKDESKRVPFKSFGNNQLFFVNAIGAKGSLKNTNTDEVEGIKRLISELSQSGFDPKKDIGLITPYTNQSRLLEEHFGKILGHSMKEQKIGTVHAFQGAEFEVMIFSAVIHSSEDSSTFINKTPNLLNVAISRSKQIFIMIGNKDKIVSSGGYLKMIYDASTNKK